MGCKGAIRRRALFDALASGENVGRDDAGNGEPGSEETRRMSSDMGVDFVFLDEIVYARFACAKLVRAGCGVTATGRTGVDAAAAWELELAVGGDAEGGGGGASFSCGTRMCDVECGARVDRRLSEDSPSSPGLRRWISGRPSSWARGEASRCRDLR